MTLADVRTAIQAELAATPEYYDFKVLRSERDGALWRVTLDSGYVFAQGLAPGQASAQSLLDDSLDGASAWWGAPAKGGASVLAVVPQDDQLVLQNASSAPPPAGALIRLYPTRFLNAVADAWWDTAWAERALAGLPDLGRPQRLRRQRSRLRDLPLQPGGELVREPGGLPDRRRHLPARSVRA